MGALACTLRHLRQLVLRVVQRIGLLITHDAGCIEVLRWPSSVA